MNNYFKFIFFAIGLAVICDRATAVENTSQQTSLIGTPEHPTIDGGVINVIDKNPVVISANENTKKSFNDTWATDERVRKFLTAASNQGKLAYVLRKSAQMKLPASVAVVPMIESNYEDKAISPKGAQGAWQLMPNTAQEHGIHDKESFQLERSTDAALMILNDLHQQFGNWQLAYAAYNAGNKRVSNALQKNPSAQSIDELDLPQETKTYVHKLTALNAFFIDLDKNQSHAQEI